MLSEAVKSHRKARGWSLRELAKRSGISPSALSKVERAELSLTYDRLDQLARGLEIGIADLFAPGTADAEPRPMSRRSVSRAADGELVATDAYEHHFLHTDLSRRAIIPLIADIKVKTLEDYGPLACHPGEEFSFVLEGQVTLYTEHYSPLVLEAGDSVYLDSSMKHAYINSGRGRARVLSVSSESAAAA